MLLTPALIRCIIRQRSGLYTCIQLLGKQEFFRKTSQISAKSRKKPIKIGQYSSKRKPTAKPKKARLTRKQRAVSARPRKETQDDKEESLQQPSGAASVQIFTAGCSRSQSLQRCISLHRDTEDCLQPQTRALLHARGNMDNRHHLP